MPKKFAVLLPLCLVAFGCENSQHAQRLERREAIREAYLRNLRGAATGFEDTRWSMSPDEVRAHYPEAVVMEGGGLELQTERWDLPARIRFSFAQQKLAAVTLQLGAPGDLREAYQGVASVIQAKYGKPGEARDSAEEAAHQRAVSTALASLALAAETAQAIQERRPLDEAAVEQLNEQSVTAGEDAYWNAQEFALLSRWHSDATVVQLLGRRSEGQQRLALTYVSTVLLADAPAPPQQAQPGPL